jgi:hypothetical protein
MFVNICFTGSLTEAVLNQALALSGSLRNHCI